MITRRNPSQRAQPGVLGKGQHDKLRMSGLFLPTLDSDAVLDGLTLGAIMKAAGEEALWRSLRSMQADIDEGTLTPPTERLTRRIRSFWEKLPESPVRDAGIAALAGEWWTAPTPAGIAGQWSLFKAIAAGDIPNRWICRLEHYVDVEVACREATLQVLAGNYRAAADLAAHSPVVSEYLNPTALRMLAHASNKQLALDPRFAGFIEFTLSHIARVDVATTTLDMSHARDDIPKLIHQTFDSQIVPGRALVQICIRLTGVDTQAALLRLDSRAAPVDESTLKRWGLGKTFPTTTSLSQFLNAVVDGWRVSSGTDDAASLLRRRLDRLQWAAQRLHVLTKLIRQPGLWQYIFRELRPDDWVRERYTYWLQHWQAQGVAVCDHLLVPETSP